MLHQPSWKLKAGIRKNLGLGVTTTEITCPQQILGFPQSAISSPSPTFILKYGSPHRSLLNQSTRTSQLSTSLIHLLRPHFALTTNKSSGPPHLLNLSSNKRRRCKCCPSLLNPTSLFDPRHHRASFYCLLHFTKPGPAC